MWGHVSVPARKETEDRYDVVVELKPGRTIKGLIHLEDKKPVPMGEVLFHCPATSISDTVQADMNGIFEIGGLPPAETVTISPWNDKRPFGERGDKKVGPEQSYVEILLMPEED